MLQLMLAVVTMPHYPAVKVLTATFLPHSFICFINCVTFCATLIQQIYRCDISALIKLTAHTYRRLMGTTKTEPHLYFHVWPLALSDGAPVLLWASWSTTHTSNWCIPVLNSSLVAWKLLGDKKEKTTIWTPKGVRTNIHQFKITKWTRCQGRSPVVECSGLKTYISQ